MEKDENQKQDETVAGPGVLEKYMEAGKICKAVLASVLSKVKVGASVNEVCNLGDLEIEEACKKVFNTKKDNKPLEKGLGFPTCISVNELCGHFSPVKDEDTVLREGDLAKVTLGVQIDGYVTLLGHTVVVSEKSDKVSDKRADVIKAAYSGLQAAVRLLKPGNKNTQVTEAIRKCAESYNCTPLEGVLSHEVQRYLLDGNNCIINKETHDQRVSEVEFQVNQVYVLDVFATTGEGKPKESELRTHVFKRSMEVNYDLKSKSARSFFAELKKRFPTFGFSLRSFQDDELMARAGLQELNRHGIVDPYPVLIEKKGDVVAQFQWTVLISAKRVVLLTSHLLDESNLQPSGEVTDQEIKDLLAIDLDSISQKRKNKKK